MLAGWLAGWLEACPSNPRAKPGLQVPNSARILSWHPTTLSPAASTSIYPPTCTASIASIPSTASTSSAPVSSSLNTISVNYSSRARQRRAARKASTLRQLEQRERTQPDHSRDTAAAAHYKYSRRHSCARYAGSHQQPCNKPAVHRSVSNNYNERFSPAGRAALRPCRQSARGRAAHAARLCQNQTGC
jgi:hypothetical protein